MDEEKKTGKVKDATF